MKLKNKTFHLKASSLFLLAFCVFLSATGQQISVINALNSPYDEQHAVLAPYGELFFSVGFHPENTGGPTDFGDIWMSSKNKKGEWNKPLRVKELSTPGNDIVVGFPDPITIFVYHSGDGRPQGIHQYTKFGNSWNYVRPLEMGNFKNSSTHFSGRLSKDGNIIIMSMKTFGSYGNEDIHVSFKKSEGVWSSPKNIGNSINTYAQEQTPYLSEDQEVLFFSSNALADRGGKNIYASRRLDETWENWSKPQPLNSANSIGSELGFANIFEEQNMAIFTTTINSEGMGDFMLLGYDPEEIFPEPIEVVPSQEDEIITKPVLTQVQIIEEVKKEEQSVVQEELKENATTMVKAEPIRQDTLITSSEAVELLTEEKKEEIERVEEKTEEAIASSVEQNSDIQEDNQALLKKEIGVQSESNQELNIVQILDINTKEPVDYRITFSGQSANIKEIDDQQNMQEEWNNGDWNNILISAKGYIPTNLSGEDWNSLENNTLFLIPAVSGASLVLKNIQFAKGTAEFEDARSIIVLDQLLNFMMENEDIRIRLEGHTDNAGDPGLNKDLSLKRASKIRAYLTVKGINFERIRISGWGGTRPVADNSTEEGRELNRRVEMYIEK
jgi:outer membrane protein OmpA-like peptidoglycan-associated protein